MQRFNFLKTWYENILTCLSSPKVFWPSLPPICIFCKNKILGSKISPHSEMIKEPISNVPDEGPADRGRAAPSSPMFLSLRFKSSRTCLKCRNPFLDLSYLFFFFFSGSLVSFFLLRKEENSEKTNFTFNNKLLKVCRFLHIPSRWVKTWVIFCMFLNCKSGNIMNLFITTCAVLKRKIG